MKRAVFRDVPIDFFNNMKIWIYVRTGTIINPIENILLSVVSKLYDEYVRTSIYKHLQLYDFYRYDTFAFIPYVCELEIPFGIF